MNENDVNTSIFADKIKTLSMILKVDFKKWLDVKAQRL